MKAFDLLAMLGKNVKKVGPHLMIMADEESISSHLTHFIADQID